MVILYRKYYFSALLLLVLSIGNILFSCKKQDNVTTLETGMEYFPVYQGYERHFVVDSIVYDDFTGSIDTFRYFIKEVVDTVVFNNNNGSKIYRFDRYYKIDDTANWKIMEEWKIEKDNFQYKTTEGNITFLRAVFPVDISVSWNGNTWNTLDDESYSYTSIHEEYVTDQNIFDSTLTIQQAGIMFLTEEIFGIEVYAKNIGLIYKYNKNVKKNPQNGEITAGFIYTYERILQQPN